MPDLNLIDDDDAMPEGAEEIITPGGGGGGGGGGGAAKAIIILLVVLIALGGGAFALNSLGIVHLWGNKKPQVMTVEEQFPQEFYDESAFAEQQPVDTSWMTEAAPSDVALLETTPIEETAKKPDAKKPDPAKPAPDKAAADAGAMKLGDMKGDYTVQVVAYREKEKADRIVQNLGVAGYPAFIEKVQMKGGEWYTVRIGKYASRADANAAVKTFAEQIRANYFIDKVRSQ